MPDWVRPMARSGHSTVWQRHPETFCRKELHVPPMKSVIKNVQSPSAVDHPCGPANFHEHPHPFPILFRCLPSSMKLGNKAFCPTLGFSISVPTDILNQIILCCGDPPVPCGIFCSILKPYMLATSSNIYRVHNLVVTTKNISRRYQMSPGWQDCSQLRTTPLQHKNKLKSILTISFETKLRKIN